MWWLTCLAALAVVVFVGVAVWRLSNRIYDKDRFDGVDWEHLQELEGKDDLP